MKMLFLLLFLLSSSTSYASSLTVATYNIRNFDYDERYRIQTNKPELAKIINSTQADLIVVQEINNTTEFVRYVKNTFSGFDAELSECGGAHGQKLGFMFNTKKLKLLSFNEDLSLSGPGNSGTCYGGSRPAAIGLFEIIATKQRFYAVSVHLKSGSQTDSIKKRLDQYTVIEKMIKSLQASSGVLDFVIAGDMNSTTYNVRGVDYKSLQSLTMALNAVDLSQSLPCTAYWWGGTDDNIEDPSILDHILISKGLIKKTVKTVLGGHCAVVSCKPMPAPSLGMSYSNVSDHCPVSAQIQ
jgi:endonuclease/exonuclease/phosphatase family metal-dependent hydrolase